MKINKKLVVTAIVLALTATATTAGTLAYFTDAGTAHNIITSGTIGIILNDNTLAEDGKTIQFPEDGISGVMPGQDVDKIVSVTNDGTGDAWVRISLETTIVNPDSNDLPTELADGKPAIEINFVENTKWIKGGDGMYYYTEPLKNGETTDELFRTVTFAPELGNEYQNCTANIIVSAQAVQVANNPIPEGGTVVDILGWPEA